MTMMDTGVGTSTPISPASVEQALRTALQATSSRTSSSSPSNRRNPNPSIRGRRINFGNSSEDEIVGQVQQLFQQARAHKRPIIRQWQKNYRMMLNRYWSAERPTWMPSPQVPEIFPIVASNVGWMTDQRFRWDISASAPVFSEAAQEFDQVARDLEAVMGASWHNNNEENELTKGLWDANIYGTGIYKTTWDASKFGALGDATFHRVDPFTWYPDPRARGPEDMNYSLEVRNMSIQELDRRWPGSAKHFADGGMIYDAEEAPTQLDDMTDSSVPRANPGAIAPATSPRYGRPGSSSIHILDDPGVTVFELWVREHEYIDGGEYGDVAYDTWRVIVVAGSKVLMNEPVENLWGHGGHPYDRYVPYDMGEMWGLSLVQMLSSSQAAINRILAALQHNIELTGNPVFVEDNRSNLQRTKITNKPGQRLTKTVGSTADWMKPPQVHQMMPELLRYYLQRMEAVSGLSAITKGGSPSGRNAQGVIDAMQEAAFVRIRMALRNMEYTLRGIGAKKINLIAENYTEPRMLSMIGEDGQKLSVTLGSRPFQTIKAAPTDPETGRPRIDFAPLNFNLLVDAGSGTHTSRKVREDMAFTLYTLGAIDDLALLEAVDFPNRTLIAQRVAKLKAAGAHQPPGARERAQH